MVRLGFRCGVVVGGLALMVPGVGAQEVTVPNLVAMASPDRQVAVTFAAEPNEATQADAGAFSTIMIERFGLLGIPNYDPTTNTSSYLVCSSPVSDTELVAVYGIQGLGVREAAAVCSYLEDHGDEVDWSPQAAQGL